MALSHFRKLIHKFLNKDPDIVPEEAPLIVLDSKSAMCMDNNGMFGILTIISHAHSRFNIQDNQRRFLWDYVWIIVQQFTNQHSEMC